METGFTFGTLIAVALSWSANHSIVWAIIHGLFSWLYVIYYVIYYVLTYGDEKHSDWEDEG